MLRAVLVATAVFLVLPSAIAAGVRIESREIVLASARSVPSPSRPLSLHAAPYRFNLVGIHWRGSGSVSFRTAARGMWSGWRTARPEAEDAPDPGNREGAATAGWKLGNPMWTGWAARIQYRTIGDVRRIRTFFVKSPITRTPVVGVAARAAAQPPIILRRAWGANERIVREEPSYADRVAFSVVHHTAGAQPTSPAQSAAIVRGIQTYHVKGNGWNDIGYNFLVDRYGQIFEGRGGGITANVIGAHAMGFNTGSTGVAVLGTFSSSPPPAGARRALVSLISWRLDLAHVNPLSRLTWRSAGNPEYPAGRKVRIRAVSGHRDTGPTTCPGDALYVRLRSIARSVRASGRPKIYAPRASGSLGGPVRIRATVDPARAWSVVVVDGSGGTVARGRGSGTTVDWTWDSSGAPAGTYRWIVSAGGAVEATGLVGSGGVVPPSPHGPELVSASVSPRVVSPNADRHKDRARLSWVTSGSAEVRVLVVSAKGRVVAKAYPWTQLPGGAASVLWNGGRLNGEPIRDGRYALRFQARSGSALVTREVRVKVDRTLGGVTVRPGVFSPNGDGRAETASVTFSLARDADVVVRVSRRRHPVRSLLEGRLAAGTHTVVWNGRAGGAVVADGDYTIVVTAKTGLGKRRMSRPVRVN